MRHPFTALYIVPWKATGAVAGGGGLFFVFDRFDDAR